MKMEMTISVIALIFSGLTFIWMVYTHLTTRFSNIKISLDSREGLEHEDGRFIPWIKYFLIVKNMSPRQTAIVDIYVYRISKGRESGFIDEELPIILKPWDVKRIQLKPSEKSPPPKYLIIEDIDNNYYALDFLNSDSRLLPHRLKKFKDKEKMDIHTEQIST